MSTTATKKKLAQGEIEVTKKDLVTFYNQANMYIGRNPKERSEVTYALNKLAQRHKGDVDKYLENLQEKNNDLWNKYGAKDDKGHFIEEKFGDGNDAVIRKKLTQENEAKLNKDYKSFQDKTDAEIVVFRPHIVAIPPQMTLAWVKAFERFIFNPMTEEEERKWYLNQGKQEPTPS